MVVLLFSEGTDFRMSKNMRWVPFSIFATLWTISILILPGHCSLQVEFNKAAQSLTDAIIPAAQKKLALTRLVKVQPV
jgi:hypothetical protein